MNFEQIFGVTGHVSWQQECARGVLIFIYGLIAVRLAGRRAFAKWSALDIVVSMVVGSSLSRALTGTVPLWGTLAATTLLFFLHWLLSHAAALSARISHLLEGRSVVLSEGGQVKVGTLMKHAVSEADLNESLRNSGLQETAATRAVVLEPSGKISVLKN